MMACTSPALTVRSMPFRISRSATVACRSLISSNAISSVFSASSASSGFDFDFLSNLFSAFPPRLRASAVKKLAHGTLETHSQQLLRLHGKLHGQLAEHFLAETVHDH